MAAITIEEFNATYLKEVGVSDGNLMFIFRDMKVCHLEGGTHVPNLIYREYFIDDDSRKINKEKAIDLQEMVIEYINSLKK